MIHDKILASYVADFAEQYELTEQSADAQFLHFVNFCIASRSTADTINDVTAMSTDGDGDNGIDGFCLLIDGHIAKSTQDIDFFRNKLHRLNGEFILVQAKSGPSFAAADIGTFLFGARTFFEPVAKPPRFNDALQDAYDLKEYLYKHSIDMDAAPACTLYYATSGEWKDDGNLLARIEGELAPLRGGNFFSEVRFVPLDAAALRDLYRSIRNKVVAEINFEKHTILPPITGITEAYLGIVPCLEYLKLIVDKNGTIQRGLFYDNVRDFQGMNPVNQEIAATLAEADSSGQFVLLNNGVTVVAKSINKVAAKFRIADYQVVNGCQTSHVLYLQRDRLTPQVFLPLKLVVTDDAEVTNRVIRATNRQTEVKVEAFESLSPFHRVLEEFYGTFKDNDRLYYERRSNQYASLPIKPRQIVTVARQTLAFLAMFLDEPHSTHRYYGELLSSNRGRMFQDAHRPLPYYTSALTFSRVLSALRRGELQGRHGRFLYHILLIMRLSIGGRSMPPLSGKKMDGYCESLLKVVNDNTRFGLALADAARAIDDSLRGFEGGTRLAPRLRDFTAKLLPYRQPRTRGRVVYFNMERGYGFVSVDGSKDVFIHHTAMREKMYAALQVGEVIDFDVVQTDQGPQARDAEIVTVNKKAEQK